MSALPPQYVIPLKNVLKNDFVPHLPPLLDQTKPLDEQKRKNISRALSAFALQKIIGISVNDAAKAVVDDFNDYGIDAIYYHATTETVYIVQSKLKESEEFNQED